VKGKSIEKDKKIFIEIPDDICDLFKLKSDMEFEVKAVERDSSKLLISLLGDLPS
jgi:hypothetical protein